MAQPLWGLRADLSGLSHGSEHLRDGSQLVGVTIRSDRDAASADALEGMTPRAAPQVQHPVARLGPKTLVVDSQHQRPTNALIGDVRAAVRRAGASASSARYCSTVLRAVAAHE